MSGDRKMNLMDALVILRMCAGLSEIPAADTSLFIAADLNRDDKLDLADALIVLQCITLLIEEF
jgi:hypothetical protein